MALFQSWLVPCIAPKIAKFYYHWKLHLGLAHTSYDHCRICESRAHRGLQIFLGSVQSKGFESVGHFLRSQICLDGYGSMK